MIVSRPEEYVMAAGPVHHERARALPARRAVRLAVTLVIASGLTVTGACASFTPAPGTVPPAAGAPAPPAPADATTAPGTTAPGTPAPTTAPPTSPAPEAADAADEMLRIGDSGPAVLEVQQRLSGLGFWLGEIDGHYGQLTRQAVLAFQKAEGLTRDGVAGPRTRQQLPVASR